MSQPPSTANSRTVFGYPRSAVVADLAGVAAVGVLLVAVHLLLPASTNDRLAFDHAAFAPVASLASDGLAALALGRTQLDNLLTAAYVHAGPAHLLSNLGGYASLAAVTYLVCLHAGRRAWFRRTVPVLLVVLPVTVNLTSYALLAARFPDTSPISRGFSGVVAGFGGFLVVAVAVHLRRTYARETVSLVGLFATALLVGELRWIYASRVGLLEGGTVAVGLALSVSGILARGYEATYADAHYRRVGQDLLYVGLVLALLVWLVYGLFPADPLADGAFTNVFAHGAGFLEGGAFAALTYVGVR
ncbi:hypothetical protein [Halorussus halobius]|uniref:hypothetical protein n=1 Tax=Halorussus halobius TaxID=1710537 RepID=UPI001093325E|nr:hypothetical protein [Halorussus halobius]